MESCENKILDFIQRRIAAIKNMVGFIRKKYKIDTPK
jgi:hypothetical protein